MDSDSSMTFISFNTSPQTASNGDNTVIPTTLDLNSTYSVAQNASLQQGCIEVVFSKMDFLPWNNPDNIVNAEAESITRRSKDFIQAFLFLIGGPANVINMAVFYKQGLKDRVNLCLFALALADVLYLSSSMLFNAEQLYVQFTTGQRFGPFITVLTNSYLTGLFGISYVSQLLSAIIATERCYCVLRPLSYQTLMRTRTMAAIIIAVFAATIGLYFIVALRFRVGCIYDAETGIQISTTVTGDIYKAHKQLIDFLHGVLFGFGLPGFVMTVVTLTTIVTAVKLRQIMTWRAGSSMSISVREVALTKMLIGSSILFIACVSPTALTRILWLLFPEVNTGRRHHNFFLVTLWIGQLFAFINSTFNIVIYYVMGSRYRETFWALFGRKMVDVDQKP